MHDDMHNSKRVYIINVSAAFVHNTPHTHIHDTACDVSDVYNVCNCVWCDGEMVNLHSNEPNKCVAHTAKYVCSLASVFDGIHNTTPHTIELYKLWVCVMHM